MALFCYLQLSSLKAYQTPKVRKRCLIYLLFQSRLYHGGQVNLPAFLAFLLLKLLTAFRFRWKPEEANCINRHTKMPVPMVLIPLIYNHSIACCLEQKRNDECFSRFREHVARWCAWVNILTIATLDKLRASDILFIQCLEINQVTMASSKGIDVKPADTTMPWTLTFLYHLH